MHRLFANNFVRALFMLMVSIVLIGLFLDKRFYIKDNSILYAEFIQSSNFSQLYEDVSHSFNYRVNGGTYNLGIPFSPANETVYGTGRGVRIISYIAFLKLLQETFHQWWDRILFVTVLVAPFFGLLLSGYLFSIRNKFAVIVAALFFAYNPWIFNRLHTGFYQLHIAYAFLPIVTMYLLHIHVKRNIREEILPVVLAGIGLSLSLLFQPHFIFGLVIASIPYGFIMMVLGRDGIGSFSIPRVLSRLFILCLITFLLISFYIVPSFVFPPTLYTTADFFNLGSLKFNGQGSTLLDVFNLTARLPWESEVIKPARNMPYVGFYLFFIWIVFSLIFRSSRKEKRILGLIFFSEMVLFSLLAKGVNPPFENVSVLLYSYIPLLQIFRDPSRLMSLIVLCGSIACMISPSTKTSNVIKTWAILYLFVCLPFLVQDLNKRMGYQRVPSLAYVEETTLPLFERVMFIPDSQPLSHFSWHSGLLSSTYNSPIEALVPSSSDMLHYTGSNDTLMSQMTLFATSHLNEKLLSRLGVRRILQQRNTPHSDQIQTQIPSGFSKTSSNDYVDVFESEAVTSALLDSAPVFFVGNRRQYLELISKISDDTPIIFLNDNHNLRKFLELDLEEQDIVYSNEHELRFLHNYLLSTYSLDLHKLVWNYDKDFNYYLPYAAQDIINGNLFPSGKSIVSTKPTSSLVVYPRKEGAYILSVASINDSLHDPFQVFLDGKLIVSQHENIEGQTWSQFAINLHTESKIEIRKSGDLKTVIDDVLLIPLREEKIMRERLERLLSKNTILTLGSYESRSENSTIKFAKTEHGEIAVDSPSRWITFRFPYDKNWEISDQSAIFVSDGYGMTFYKKPTENSKLLYKPEQTFQILLSISKFVLLCLLSLIVWQCLRRFAEYGKNRT